LPIVAPGTVDPASMTGADNVASQASAVLDALNAALAADDAEKLASCFYQEQAFWRDIVALTSHLRTFAMPSVIAAAFLRMRALRRIEDKIELAGDPHFSVMSPVMVSQLSLIFFNS
jgi:hypothetical protein